MVHIYNGNPLQLNLPLNVIVHIIICGGAFYSHRRHIIYIHIQTLAAVNTYKLHDSDHY